MNHMCMKRPGVPEAKMVPTRYRFRKPAMLRIRRADGLTVMEGFGIGEIITILSPDIQYLVCSYEEWDEVPMPNGEFIVEWPEDIDMEWVYE